MVKTKAVLAAEGWDDGATSIFYRMTRDGHLPPSVRTVHRVLVREGQIAPQPEKRRRSSYRSFQFPATDDCWQLDAWEFVLADGTVVVIFELLDDRSRSLVNTWAWEGETTLGAWHGVAAAIGDYGRPLMLLCDNSLAFTGRLHRQVVLFEKNLARLGIKMINSSPHHPQTCGKDERHHQTSARWLAARPTPGTLAELQTLLDAYRAAYNTRPHQSLTGTTPLEQRAASRRITPVPRTPTPVPTTVTMPTANSRGAIGVAGVVVGLGVEYAGQQLICFTTDDDVQIFYQPPRAHLHRRPPPAPTKHPCGPAAALGDTPCPADPHTPASLHRCPLRRRAAGVKGVVPLDPDEHRRNLPSGGEAPHHLSAMSRPKTCQRCPVT